MRFMGSCIIDNVSAERRECKTVSQRSLCTSQIEIHEMSFASEQNTSKEQKTTFVKQQVNTEKTAVYYRV